MNSGILKVGDTVNWKGRFGTAPAVKVVVSGMELCDEPLTEINWDEVNSRQLVVDLDNNRWAYGTQISKI